MVIVTSANDVQVVIADHKQFSTSDDMEVATKLVEVQEIIVNENYDTTTLDSDIALLKLKEALDLISYKEIKPVCLPTVKSKSYEGYEGIVIGWGKIHYSDSDNYLDTQEGVTMSILSPECEGLVNDYLLITTNMLCAGSADGGKDSCLPDAGGSLVVKEGATYTLVGVVSLEFSCGDAEFRGVYTRVTQFLDWIENNTRDSNYCPVTSTCTCGQANGEVRIIGGEDVIQQNRYPWLVGIYLTNVGNLVVCGGAIINDLHIITAARCVKSPTTSKEVFVAIADHKQFSASDDVEGVTKLVEVQEIILHEAFSTSTGDSDIALLRLKEPLDLISQAEIKPICLPKDKSKTYEGYNGTVVGWGKLDHDDSLNYPDTLKGVTVPILSPECEGKNANDLDITDNMLCAGFTEGGKDSCQGDSGGPLVMKEGTTYTLVGVASFSLSGCGEPEFPGIYVRVTQFLDWIEEKATDSTYCPAPE